MNSFEQRIAPLFPDGLHAGSIRTLQVNVGRLCNMSCHHCHLAASPARGEIMTWSTMASLLRAADALAPEVVDITGGAPEMNPDIRRFVAALREAGHVVQLRTNFTALLEPAAEGLIDFLAEHAVALVGSLPCYLSENVDAQRGENTYEDSIRVLKQLNAVGYGVEPSLPIALVYNPGGAFLPPAQSDLEGTYRTELRRRFGIQFTSLLAITNMPVGRFAEDLEAAGTRGTYQTLLMDAFNADAVTQVMCRHQLCVDWDGRLYDCDFNLALGLPLTEAMPGHIDACTQAALAGRPIKTGEHCWGCTAGAGSSCAGALA
jgi:radical SAM/Cys-rich protein